MELAFSIIAEEIARILKENIMDIKLDAQKVLEIESFKIVKEIHNILTNNSHSDFEMIEEIVCVFEKYGIECGGCHDF